MLESPALWGNAVAAQLETLRADLELLNELKKSAMEKMQIVVDPMLGSAATSNQLELLEKIDGMINRRLDVMISLETDQTDEEDDESESETPTEEGGQ